MKWPNDVGSLGSGIKDQTNGFLTKVELGHSGP